MGTEIDVRGHITGVAENGLHAAKIMLDTASVGATVNIMLAASLIAGEETIILNAAREPHIVDLGKFLTSCGVGVTGAGTSEIHIRGVRALHGCTHFIIPDMIEAGTPTWLPSQERAAKSSWSAPSQSTWNPWSVS